MPLQGAAYQGLGPLITRQNEATQLARGEPIIVQARDGNNARHAWIFRNVQVTATAYDELRMHAFAPAAGNFRNGGCGFRNLRKIFVANLFSFVTFPPSCP